MQSPEAVRFIDVTPFGALNRLGQAGRSPERDVIERLLSMDSLQPVSLRAMSASMACSIADLAKVMFALNRAREIQVGASGSSPVEPAGDELAGLDDDLRTLAGTGQCALLASSDGLCIAATGWTAEEADRMAGRLFPGGEPEGAAHILTLCFAREHVVFCASTSVDCGHPSWVRMARRLLRACGPLGHSPGAH